MLLTTGLFYFEGVTDIQTNVEAKSVIVQADDSVSPQLMLEKLQAVSHVDVWIFGIYRVR
jgi:hypothetical protein